MAAAMIFLMVIEGLLLKVSRLAGDWLRKVPLVFSGFYLRKFAMHPLASAARGGAFGLS